MNWAVLAALLLLFAVVLWFFHYGYIPYTDQKISIRGAIGWLDHFPFLGTTHWELRHPFIWSLAASLALFGPAEWALHLPSVLVGVLCLCAFYILMARLAPPRVAILGTLLLATVPLMCFTTTTLYPEVFEALFCLVGLNLYLTYLQGGHQRRMLFCTGIAFGFAFLVRETAAQILVALLLFYLVAVRRDFLRHFLVVFGFVLVVSFELVYGYLQIGDPFFRYRVDISQFEPGEYVNTATVLTPTFDNRDLEIRAVYEPETVERGTFSISGAVPGPFDMPRWLSPYGQLLVNHEYGGLYFGLVLAAVGALLLRARLGRNAPAVVLLACVFVGTMVVLNYVLPLRPLPRYYLVLVIASAGLLGLLIDTLARAGRGWLAWPLLALVLFGNVLGLDLRTPRWLGERVLAENPWQLDGPVYVERGIFAAARYFLEVAEAPPEVRIGTPEPGSYYLFVSDSTHRTTERGKLKPGADWEEMWRMPVDERWAGQLLRLVGADALLPASLYRKLLRPDSEVVLYRVGELPLDSS